MLTDGPSVVAIVPTLAGNIPRLQACLNATLASDFDGDLKVVVVWNDPRVPVPELPGVEVLVPGLNLGFPGALNHARSRVDADFLWILQDDVMAAPNCLRALLGRINAADQPAVVSPVVLTPDGLVRAHSRGGVLNPDGAMAYWFPQCDTPPDELDLGQPLDYVPSSGTLARLSVWDEVGGFDPEFYPLLWSDVDFCYRVRRAGHRLALVPEAVIEHERNSSTPGLFGQFLSLTNQDRFRSKNLLGTPPLAVHVDADEPLVRRVGTTASLALVDFAAHASSAHKAACEQVEQLGAQLQAEVAARAHAEELGTQLHAEVAARDQRISRLSSAIAEHSGAVGVRDQRIARLNRRVAAREQRILALKGELAAIQGSRSWRAVRLLRSVRAQLSRRGSRA